jgi:hypothetical protein
MFTLAAQRASEGSSIFVSGMAASCMAFCGIPHTWWRGVGRVTHDMIGEAVQTG